MREGLIDCIVTPRQGNRLPDDVAFCADNGCGPGKRRDRFNPTPGYPGPVRFDAWLRTLPADRCEFVVAPDVVANAAKTLRRAAAWMPRIRRMGFRVAFAAQNGQESLPVPWDDFDVLFVGGSTEWKLGPHARALVIEAKARGKAVHMGRVNSHKRIAYARHIGCDSADGTYIARGPDVNLPKALGWLRRLDREPELFGGAR